MSRKGLAIFALLNLIDNATGSCFRLKFQIVARKSEFLHVLNASRFRFWFVGIYCLVDRSDRECGYWRRLDGKGGRWCIGEFIKIRRRSRDSLENMERRSDELKLRVFEKM